MSTATKKGKGRPVKIFEHVENADAFNIELIKNDIGWLKKIVGAGFAALLAVILAQTGLVTYLHNDTKAEMNRRFTEQKAEMNRRFTEQKAEINEITEKVNKIGKDITEIKALMRK